MHVDVSPVGFDLIPLLKMLRIRTDLVGLRSWLKIGHSEGLVKDGLVCISLVSIKDQIHTVSISLKHKV